MAFWRTRRLIFFDLERQRSPIVDMAFLLGGLVAFNAPPSLRMTTVIASLLGLYHGYANGAGMGEPSTAAIALSGLSFAVFVIVALASAFVVQLQSQWARIAVRVAGSWITASGLLMLGWALRAR
jgi:urease accessory protein